MRVLLRVLDELWETEGFYGENSTDVKLQVRSFNDCWLCRRCADIEMRLLGVNRDDAHILPLFCGVSRIWIADTRFPGFQLMLGCYRCRKSKEKEKRKCLVRCRASV